MSEMIARGLAKRLAKHRGQSTGARTGAARISNTSLAQQWGHQDNFAAVPKSRSAGVEMPPSPSACRRVSWYRRDRCSSSCPLCDDDHCQDIVDRTSLATPPQELHLTEGNDGIAPHHVLHQYRPRSTTCSCRRSGAVLGMQADFARRYRQLIALSLAGSSPL